tara:strand:- start:2147 stop:2482 length:336 start_codon:yes stop_codon:yes gene_type:complete
MTSYFKEDKKMIRESFRDTLPVTPTKNKWTMLDDPEVLQRLFEFKNTISLLYFLEDLVQLQDTMNHHGRILIDHMSVLVQINTKSLERVTDLDVEWAQKVDEIYKDTRQSE